MSKQKAENQSTNEVSDDKVEKVEEQAVKAAEAAPETDYAALYEEAQKKADESLDALLRAKAEFENLRKRTQKDVENAHKYALERIAGELLAVRDSMELGLNSALGEDVNIESLQEGAKLTLKMLVQLMEKFNIEEIDPHNEKFNPEHHQAMSTQESDKLEPNTVISVMQKGYLLGDRLLRPALVVVSKQSAGQTET